MIKLDLYGDPVAWQRPQFARRGAKLHSYDGQEKLKVGCKWQLKSQFRDQILTAPVSIDLTFYMPIPKSTTSIRKRQMLHGKMYHMKRPDLDNLQKFVLDCLNQIILADDAQVVEIRARKIYSDKPGTLIRILPLTEQQTITEDYEDITRRSG